MNQGKIWCVVSPTVGLPLFLGSVATIALLVHASVMTHTTWMANYWQGAKAKVADNAKPGIATASTQDGMSFTVSPVANANGTTSFTVTVAPSTVTTASTSPGSDAVVQRTASAEAVPR